MHELDLTAGPPLPDAALIDSYAPDRTTPRVRVNFVTSLDGAVTLDGHSGGLGDEADRRAMRALRLHADGVMVGAGTVRVEGYGSLGLDAADQAWRVARGLTAYPRMVMVSGRLDLEPSLPALAAMPVRPVVVTRATADVNAREALSGVADVLVHGVDRVDLRGALAELRDRYGISQLLCEGGPHLFGSLLAEDLVDEVCLTVSGLVAGPGAGRIVAGPSGVPARSMRLTHALTEGSTLLLRYARER